MVTIPFIPGTGLLQSAMAGVTDILPVLPVQRAISSMGGVKAVPQPPIEQFSQSAPAGVEVMLQKLLEVRGEIGGPDKARAEREAPVREFHGAPVTYGGFSPSRRAPTEIVRLLAVA